MCSIWDGADLALDLQPGNAHQFLDIHRMETI